MTNNVGLAFSNGDTIPWFTMSIEQDNLELVTLNIIFNTYYSTCFNPKSVVDW